MENKSLSDMTLEQLWQLFPITLTEHDPRWAEQYAEERAALKDIIPCKAVYHHIGSTAVDGIMAKPIIDILIVVETAADMATVRDALRKNGYIVMSESVSRISLNKGYTENGYADRVFHLHIRTDGDIDEVYFRDYLISHPDIAAQYERLKLGLWKKFEHDRDAYTAAKTEFVAKYTQIAKAARKETAD